MLSSQVTRNEIVLDFRVWKTLRNNWKNENDLIAQEVLPDVIDCFSQCSFQSFKSLSLCQSHQHDLAPKKEKHTQNPQCD